MSFWLEDWKVPLNGRIYPALFLCHVHVFKIEKLPLTHKGLTILIVKVISKIGYNIEIVN